jgi:hypothetical protein
MIDLKILEECGCTEERLRKVFTAKLDDDFDDEGNEKPESEKLFKWRELWEDRIEEDIFEGVQFGLRNYYIYASADLAWDGNIITKEIVPHMLYAQGKLKFSGWLDLLKECGCDDIVSSWCATDEHG